MKRTIILFFKGCAMGSADLVPGISGATIALVLKIYPQFVNSIKNILSYKTLSLLSKLRFKEIFHHGQLYFLLPVVAGIFTIIFSLSHLISFLLKNHPIPFWSFFFGIILASALVLPNYRDNFSAKKIVLMFAGALFGYWFLSLTTFTTPDNTFMMFIAGMCGISAMILPGISGSFVLVIIGKYQFLIESIKSLDFQVLIAFALGGLLALMIFTRLIELVFKNKKIEQTFIILISGFLIGSLRIIWPWQLINPSTGEKVQVSPSYYSNITQADSQLWFAILLSIAGMLVIIWFNRLQNKSSI